MQSDFPCTCIDGTAGARGRHQATLTSKVVHIAVCLSSHGFAVDELAPFMQWRHLLLDPVCQAIHGAEYLHHRNARNVKRVLIP